MDMMCLRSGPLESGELMSVIPGYELEYNKPIADGWKIQFNSMLWLDSNKSAEQKLLNSESSYTTR